MNSSTKFSSFNYFVIGPLMAPDALAKLLLNLLSISWKLLNSKVVLSGRYLQNQSKPNLGTLMKVLCALNHSRVIEPRRTNRVCYLSESGSGGLRCTVDIRQIVARQERVLDPTGPDNMGFGARRIYPAAFDTPRHQIVSSP